MTSITIFWEQKWLRIDSKITSFLPFVEDHQNNERKGGVEVFFVHYGLLDDKKSQQKCSNHGLKPFTLP